MNGTSLENLRTVFRLMFEKVIMGTARDFGMEQDLCLWDPEDFGENAVAEGVLYPAGSNHDHDPILLGFKIQCQPESSDLEMVLNYKTPKRTVTKSVGEGIIELLDALLNEGSKVSQAIDMARETTAIKLMATGNMDAINAFLLYFSRLEKEYQVAVFTTYGAGWNSPMACMHTLIVGKRAEEAVKLLDTCPLFTITIDSCPRCGH